LRYFFYLKLSPPCSPPPPLPPPSHSLTAILCLRRQLFPAFADNKSLSHTAWRDTGPNKPIWSIRTALMHSEQIAGWSCSGCKLIRARAHYVALITVTPPPINTWRGRKFREGTPLYQNNSRR
jgi:hypothetical protein